MRIVIQNAVSRSYFDGRDWDANEELAAQFENVVKAEQACRLQNLGNALIVLKFSAGDEEISYWPGDVNSPVHNPSPHCLRA